jgi:hypothetical protein
MNTQAKPYMKNLRGGRLTKVAGVACSLAPLAIAVSALFATAAQAQIYTTASGISVVGVTPATVPVDPASIAIGSAASAAGVNATALGSRASAAGGNSVAVVSV